MNKEEKSVYTKFKNQIEEIRKTIDEISDMVNFENATPSFGEKTVDLEMLLQSYMDDEYTETRAHREAKKRRIEYP